MDIKLKESTAKELSIILDHLLINAFDYDLSSDSFIKLTNIKAEIDSQLDR